MKCFLVSTTIEFVVQVDAATQDPIQKADLKGRQQLMDNLAALSIKSLKTRPIKNVS